MAIENLKERLVKQVEAYLSSNKWHFKHDDRRSVFNMGFSLKNKLESAQASIICRDTGVSFWFHIPAKPQKKTVQATMEFLMRANSGLINGAFEMDLDDNEILFNIFLPCDNVPSTALIDAQVDTGLATLELLGDELFSVLSGKKHPGGKKLDD